MSTIYRPTFVEINLGHLKHNYQFFASSPLGKNFFCAMVKANAYGHGDVEVVRALESFGCKTFGVGLVEEGLHLRENGCKSEILAFGFTGAEAVKDMLHHCLTPVVSDWRQLEDLVAHAKNEVAIHLKFNTGMHRLGFTAEEAEKVFDLINHTKNLKVIGIGTHLASSEDLGTKDSTALVQLQNFKKIIAGRGGNILWHAYNTAGALRALSDPAIAKQFPYGIRAGIGLFGQPSCDSDLGRNLYPVATLKSKIVSVQKVQKGQSVSYGGTWKAPKDSVVGIVPVGYADGIPTQLSNKGHVMVGDQKCSIVGRVCMDYTLVDVSELGSPLGFGVEFFGSRISAAETAVVAGTIVYDIFTRLSERVPRVFVKGEAT